MAMNIMEEKFYSIGEFARLSGTTRDSLIHYDNIGLLKPARVGENGYRYYVLMQVYQVKWIQYMQRLGLRLHDIQKTMGGGSAERNNFIQLLEQASENFEKEIFRYKMLLRASWNTIRTLKRNQKVLPNIPFLQQMEEEYLIVSEIKLETFQDPLQLGYLQELTDYLDDNFLWSEIYIGSIVSQDRLEKGNISTNYWYTRAAMPLQDEKVMIKPAGLYVVMDHYGSPYDLVASHEKMIDYMSDKGYKIAGNAYEADFGGYWPGDENNNVLIRIMIQAESKEEK